MRYTTRANRSATKLTRRRAKTSMKPERPGAARRATLRPRDSQNPKISAIDAGAGAGMARRGNLPQCLAGASRSAARWLGAALQRRSDASRQFGKSVAAGLARRSAGVRGTVSKVGPADDNSRAVAD